jgi:hypothetical protein
MPLIYRIFGYGGNVLLLLFGLAGMFSEGGAWLGVFMIALAGLNLYLIRRIDLYSREEAWLEAELHKRELRRQIAEFDHQAGGGGTAAEPRRIPPSNESGPPSG